jgi:hypothetical protein
LLFHRQKHDDKMLNNSHIICRVNHQTAAFHITVQSPTSSGRPQRRSEFTAEVYHHGRRA